MLSIDSTELTNGVHTVKFTICDNAGNCTSSTNYSVKLDRSPPKFKFSRTIRIPALRGLSIYILLYMEIRWYHVLIKKVRP